MNKITLDLCSDYVIRMFGDDKSYVSYKSNKINVVTIKQNDRTIEFKLTRQFYGRIILDITDSYGMIHIPRRNFGKMTDYEAFILSIIDNFYFILK